MNLQTLSVLFRNICLSDCLLKSNSANVQQWPACELSESSLRSHSVSPRWPDSSLHSHEFSSGLNLFHVSSRVQLSGYDASCLSKGQVAGNNISGEEADVGELLRGCEA